MTVVVDPIKKLAELSEANIELAAEIHLLLNQAIAESALDKAVTKTQVLMDNVTETRRLVTEYQATHPPKERE